MIRREKFQGSLKAIKKACYKPKSATGPALEAYRTYSDLGGEL